ncbi:SMP-30/gluconolactonase/LRE family protein [Oricola sp.]|uniref:SMP-30/gluconolactonase/LRE family protein n=1 Tax=Oricola sp. TaxID=1979950 RepID=UPI0025E8AE0C|nr:SMP-30/gluconolactonase/LRE family protein [Oricola sp.]MCI5077897.1 SMP-30/gluconolactonase/LRE family protein [Oricola sp.]
MEATQSGVTVLSETPCRLGEGPTFDPARQTLFWFDILEAKRYALHLPSGTQTVLDLPEMASAMAVIDAERDLIFTETGLHILHTATGKTVFHRPIEADTPATRCNDARVHPSGAFWLGTMGKQAEDGAGAIYRYFRGTVEVLFDRISIPNATCFSPDGTRAWYVDSRKRQWMTVAVDPANGAPIGEPALFHDFGAQKGAPDGAICDADGNLWLARYGIGRLNQFSPQGNPLQSIDIPAAQTTCPAFAGDGRIAVTTAFQDLDAAARAADPLAGQTFLVETPVRPNYDPPVAFGGA